MQMEHLKLSISSWERCEGYSESHKGSVRRHPASQLCPGAVTLTLTSMAQVCSRAKGDFRSRQQTRGMLGQRCWKQTGGTGLGWPRYVPRGSVHHKRDSVTEVQEIPRLVLHQRSWHH